MAVSYNIKTGADTSCYFSREVTQSDTDHSEANLGLIKDSVEQDTDYYEYPVLVRRTGDSLKGTTDNIESNELRKGRTKSAPRKGNSSSEGSLDFEFSPETYDDILEATLRDKFRPYTNDTTSPSNLDKKTFTGNYEFASKKMEGTEVVDCTRTLLSNTSGEGIIKVKDPENYEVAELNCGTQDIRYDVVKQYGGVEGEDLYQDFEHLCVNSIDMSITPGQIVTGSFSFMGSNNPDLLPKEAIYKDVGDGTKTEFTIAERPESLYWVKVDGKVKTVTTDYTYDADTGKVTFTSAPATGKKIEVAYNGIIKVLKGRFKTAKNETAVSEWIDDLPKKGTSTDQYTAQQGFLYINGERVRYGSNLSFSLNNGLSKTFAIFEKDAIAMSPLSLDITGSLGVYLIKGYSEKLYNMCTGDKDVEVLFCFQDKEENPDNLYVCQIFKTKFTSADMSSGAENLEVSLPIQSFEERAMRIFRIRRKKILTVIAGNVPASTASQKFNGDGSKKNFDLSVNPKPATVTVKVGDATKTSPDDYSYDPNTGTVTFVTAPDVGTENIEVSYDVSASMTLTAKLSTAPSTAASADKKVKFTYKVGTGSEQTVEINNVTTKTVETSISTEGVAADTSVEVTAEFNGSKHSKTFKTV